jgi:hypothetical protein
MKGTILFVGAAAMGFVPASATAAPAPHNSPSAKSQTHVPAANGQPDQDCEDLVADGEGATPGHSAGAPGGGSPFGGEDSTAGSHYAGSQPQNSRNPASVSQYDVACANQPE